MEMRACEETEMSRDLTPPIPPLAASLHDSSLLSHCSSCFVPVPDVGRRRGHEVYYPPCCRGGLRYCSTRCRDVDVVEHASSGECQLFRLVRDRHYQLSAWREGDFADLRVALRLMYSFEKLGILPGPRAGLSRIGGLSAGDPGFWEEESEMRQKTREGVAMMSQARKLLRGDADCARDSGNGSSDVEEAVLWVVITNAVEVQVGEGRAIGIAIYGPRFSWFNHSCSPNSCYRFELMESGCFRTAESRFLLYPMATGSEDGTVMSWDDETGHSEGFCRYGPRIVVRSIKKINQGEEVCITYTDLLQPTELRRSDLFSKYGFICCCKRCTALPEMYVDHILSATTFGRDMTNLNSSHRCHEQETEELPDALNQVVTELLSTGGPEACCSYIENMLCRGFRGEWLQLEKTSTTRFKLQPLHHISLNAYLILASLYRIQGSGPEASGHGKDGISEIFDRNRAAVAFSLLLAGATHHLFLSEPSLIATTALFWISAGESCLGLVRSSLHGSLVKWVNLSEFTRLFGDARGMLRYTGQSLLPSDELNTTSTRFLGCVSSISTALWPFVVSGIQCLRDVKSPVDFSWPESEASHRGRAGGSTAPRFCRPGPEESRCMGCRCETTVHIEENNKNLYRLAIHCLVFGGFLATICYGYQSYWADRVRELLCPDTVM